jgi:hypothetical protein
MAESIRYGIIDKASLGKKQDPISEITWTKRAGGRAQVVELLPKNCKALSSNSTATQNKQANKAECTSTKNSK